MFHTLIVYVLVGCPALLTCVFFAWCWHGFKEDRELHPIYRRPKEDQDLYPIYPRAEVLSQTEPPAWVKQGKRCT